MLLCLLGSTWSRAAAFQSSVPVHASHMRRQAQAQAQPYRSVSKRRLGLAAVGSASDNSLSDRTSTTTESTSTLTSNTNALYLPGRPDFPIQSVMAPMVGQSDYAFRCLCRQYGVDLTYTQMLHSRNLMQDHTFSKNHMDLYECNGNGDHTRDNKDAPPLMVQLAGHCQDTVVAAALKILDHSKNNVAGFDLNLGCPQNIARKGNYGAFLMEKEETTVMNILTALRQALPARVAVSAKIRLPLTDALLKSRIPRLLDTGIDFMTIHGRTLYENKTKVGPCHVDRLRLAIELAQQHHSNSNSNHFPVVANGGIEHFGDVSKLRQGTGAVATMSSEALLERPNLFTVDSSAYTPRQVMEQQFQFARDYLKWCKLYPPLPGVMGPTHGSFNVVKGHLFKFLHRYLQEHPDVRNALSGDSKNTRTKVMTIEQAEIMIDDLYGRYADQSDEEMEYKLTMTSPLSDTSWYRRHWEASARVHQRPVRITSDLMPGSSSSSNSQLSSVPVPALSIQDRKRIAKQRIAKLQEERRLQEQRLEKLSVE
jgi:tRNA-dihydrouridine synthase